MNATTINLDDAIRPTEHEGFPMTETPTAPAPYELVKKAINWKDNLAGWHNWKIKVPCCKGCGKKNTFFTLTGTEVDAKKFAADPEMQYCEKCS